MRRDDGACRNIQAVETARTDAQGQTEWVVGTNLDVTERTRTEESIRRAKEIAENANAAKDRFLAILSHELRTPLTPVLAAAEILEGADTLAAEQRTLAKMIHRNIELEARLIDDLLDITRIAHNKLQLRTVTVDVHEAIAHVLDMCREDSAAKRVAVTADLEAARHHAEADPARLQQILWNLISNAIKFTPEAGRLAVRTGNTPEGRLQVQVIDNGVGIDPEMLPRIFDAFEQGGRDVTKQFGGLGLGLAIAKALVEMHGGTIQASSDGKERGATITVTLPVSVKVLPEGREHEPRDAATLNCSLLLVEDHADTRRTMAKLLTMIGCKVKTAGTVAEAMDAAAAERFDLVLSDIGLPDGTGLDLMRRGKAQFGLRGIALSGFGMEEDVAKSLEAGFEAHLTKPVNILVLAEMLRRLTVRG